MPTTEWCQHYILYYLFLISNSVCFSPMSVSQASQRRSGLPKIAQLICMLNTQTHKPRVTASVQCIGCGLKSPEYAFDCQWPVVFFCAVVYILRTGTISCNSPTQKPSLLPANEIAGRIQPVPSYLRGNEWKGSHIIHAGSTLCLIKQPRHSWL